MRVIGVVLTPLTVHYVPMNPAIPTTHHIMLQFLPPQIHPPSESIQEPPGDLSPSPASRIVTLIPSLLSKLAWKACNAALSSSVHTSPSGPCAAWNICLSTWNGLGEELVEELGMTEESSSVTGERGGGPGVGGLRPERGGGMGMAIDSEGSST